MNAPTPRTVAVAACADVPPGTTATVQVEGREIVVLGTDDGWWAIGAVCPHAGAPLADATVSGCVLVCPWHEAVFDVRDGTVLRGPARRALRTYPTTVRDGTVVVEIEEA